MSQFKRFNSSDNTNWNSSNAYPEGTLTWDSNNGLRVHDGNTSGGNSVGVSSYNDLYDKPFIPGSLTDLISSGGSNDLQFLRYNGTTGLFEFSSDFRVVPFSDVAYPNGTLGQDKAGDLAFSAEAIYYCVQEPNSYSLTWVDPAGWAGGIIQLSNLGPNNEVLAVGSKLTDGTTVATVTELITNGWDGTRQVVRIDPEISQWRSGTGTLTALTNGTSANTEIWVKFSKNYNDLTDKPTVNYAQTTGNPVTVPSGSSLPFTIISATITTTGNPVRIHVCGDCYSNTGGNPKIQIYRETAGLGRRMTITNNGSAIPYAIEVIDPVAAGTYTYSLKISSGSIGNGTFFGADDGNILTITELK